MSEVNDPNFHLPTHERMRIVILSALLLGTVFLALPAGETSVNFITDCTQPTSVCPHDIVPLGTWLNFPSTPTELFGNSTFEKADLPLENSGTPLGSIAVQWEVGCINPSNTANSTLILQFINVTDQAPQFPGQSGGPLTFNGGWQNFLFSIQIDNIAITGVCSSTSPFQIISQGNLIPNQKFQNNGWLFRVVGEGGGGNGDNPRFADINIMTYQVRNNLYNIGFTSSTFSSFVSRVTTDIPVSSSYVANFKWQATNQTSTSQCGLNTSTNLLFHCYETGSTSCTIPAGSSTCLLTTSFTTAFTKNNPMLTFSPTPSGGLFPTIYVQQQTIQLFSLPTITV